jgi:hypothetical protein
MTIWVLFIIMLDSDRYYVQPNSFYSTMDKCFEARDVFMATAPQPKINYEAVCVQTDRVQMQ